MMDNPPQAHLRCPFPNCGSRQPTAEPLCRRVYRCASCARLSMRCAKPGCDALNRPFSRYCRHCRVDLFSRSQTVPVTRLWSEARRFGYAWQFPRSVRPEGIAAPLGPPVLVAKLGQLLQPERSALLEWSFIDGVLAVHQGGGFVALIHPFFDLEGGHRAEGVFSQHRESQCVSIPAGSCQAETFRPYPPAVTADRRRAIFSTPYAVFVLDLDNLPGWAAVRAESDFRKVLDFTSRTELCVAAAPIPLGPESDKVGVLIWDRNAERYRWSVQEVAAGHAMAEPGSEADVGVPLPLCGERCQCHLVGDDVVAISTTHEHWVWRCVDARQSRTQAMVRTWPPAGRQDGWLSLDRHVQDRTAFSWPRQQVLVSPGRGPIEGFDWYYQSARDAGAANSLEYYHLSLSGLAAQRPMGFSEAPAGLPIGPWRSPDSGLEEMLFVESQRGGALYRQMPGRPCLTSLQGCSIVEDGIDSLRLDDPLVTVLSSDPETPGRRRITFYSLRHPGGAVQADKLPLVADPLVWSRWLLTCERNESGVCLFRRNLPIDPLSSSEARK